MFRPIRASRRPARPSLEPLERRNLLSATPLSPEVSSLVPGYAHVSFERVIQALPAIEQQLQSPPPAPAQADALPGPISADLNHDGVADEISLRLSPGGHSVTLQVVYGATPTQPPATREIALDFVARRLLVGDFDGDGNTDIFLQDSASPSLDDGQSSNGMLLMGRPDGLFDAYRHTPAAPSFAVADLHTPGVDEFIYGPLGPTAAAGSGGVRAAAVASVEPPATDIQCVDLDGNGTRDIVTSTGDGSVAIYAGLGDGRFSTQPIQVADSFAGTGPVHVAFAALSAPPAGSGAKSAPLMDMVVASSSRSEVEVFRGLGGGRFLAGQVLHVGLSPSSVVLQDVMNDGVPDLIVTSAGTNTLWIFRGLGDGRFDDAQPLILPTGQNPTTAFVGNFDGAGPNEIVTLDRWSNAMTFYRGVGGPSAQSVQIASGGVGPTAAVVRDVNGDGYDDLIVANHDSGQVTLFYGGPTGLHIGQTIDRPGTHPAALAVGPGLPSSYQFYVLDDGGSRVQILTFDPPPADGLPTEGGEAPKLDPAPEVRVVLQPTSGSRADSVPVLLVAASEGEEAGQGSAQPPPRVPPLDPAVGRPDKSTAAALALRATAEAVEAAEPNQSAAQRYLLGLDDIPAPALGPAPAGPPSLMPEPGHAANSSEPAAPGGEAKREEPAEEAVADVPPAEESEAVAIGDFLAGVVLALALPGAAGEEPGSTVLNRVAGTRDTT